MGFLNLIFWVIIVYRFFLNLKNITFQYWQDKDIACEQPWPLFGNMIPLMFKRISLWELYKKWYKVFPGEKYIGVYVFLSPKLVIRNLDVIKRITIKDFDSFMDRSKYVYKKNLSMLKGQEWKNVRCTLSPAFGKNQMKYIISLVSESAEQVVEYFLQQQKHKINVEMSDVSGRYASDSIIKIIFGYKVNSLVDRNNSMYNVAKEIIRSGELRAPQFSMFLITPVISLFTKFARLLSKFIKHFDTLSKYNLKIRKSKHVIRPDLIDLFLQAIQGKLTNETDASFEIGSSVVEELAETKENDAKIDLSDEFLTSLSLKFFFDGFELTSKLICYMSHELCISPQIQKKLQEEIDKTLKKHKGNITYECVASMKYLDMVVSESLRKWPPTPLLERVCLKDYELEPETKEKDALIIEKNTTVLIPVVGLHYDPKYFPKPEKFDPERFNEKNKSKIKPFSFLPFGIGPRNCIGSRIALIQIKLFFVHLLSKFTIVSTKKTKKKIEMSINTLAFVPDNGFCFGVEKRTNKIKE